MTFQKIKSNYGGLLVRYPLKCPPKISGYGKQPLFPLLVEFNSLAVLARSIKSVFVGFRSVELVREEDSEKPDFATEKGESFYFKVNDVPIFCKGADYIPPDCFDCRVTPGKLTNILQSAVDASIFVYSLFPH